VTLLVLVKAAKTVFWGKETEAVSAPAVREAPASMCIAMVILAALCLGIGLYPRAVYHPLDKAAACVQTIREGEAPAEPVAARADHH